LNKRELLIKPALEGACAPAIAFNASTASWPPAICAGVAARPYHDEIVPRDLPAIDAVAGGDEFLFRLRVMHENQVCVVARGRLKRLPGSLSQNMHGYAGFLGKGRQDVRQQARIFD